MNTTNKRNNYQLKRTCNAFRDSLSVSYDFPDSCC
nr:MAG TPA: hypothetical protein [Caudoviricetes sp.]